MAKPPMKNDDLIPEYFIGRKGLKKGKRGPPEAMFNLQVGGWFSGN
jgi:hypothetical protein